MMLIGYQKSSVLFRQMFSYFVLSSIKLDIRLSCIVKRRHYTVSIHLKTKTCFECHKQISTRAKYMLFGQVRS